MDPEAMETDTGANVPDKKEIRKTCLKAALIGVGCSVVAVGALFFALMIFVSMAFKGCEDINLNLDILDGPFALWYLLTKISLEAEEKVKDEYHMAMIDSMKEGSGFIVEDPAAHGVAPDHIRGITAAVSGEDLVVTLEMSTAPVWTNSVGFPQGYGIVVRDKIKTMAFIECPKCVEAAAFFEPRFIVDRYMNIDTDNLLVEARGGKLVFRFRNVWEAKTGDKIRVGAGVQTFVKGSRDLPKIAVAGVVPLEIIKIEE